MLLFESIRIFQLYTVLLLDFACIFISGFAFCIFIPKVTVGFVEIFACIIIIINRTVFFQEQFVFD